MRVDVSLAADVRTMMEAAERHFGRLDILVNNAGIYPSTSGAAIDEAGFDRMFAVNVKAPFFLVEAIAPALAVAKKL